MVKKEQKLPKWFNGEVYDKGAVVQNRFGGAEIELNNIELSMYDLAKGAVFLNEWELVSKSLTWFKENNEEAYNILFEDDYWRRGL